MLSDVWIYTCGNDHKPSFAQGTLKITDGRFPRCCCGCVIVPQDLYVACVSNGFGLAQMCSLEELQKSYPAKDKNRFPKQVCPGCSQHAELVYGGYCSPPTCMQHLSKQVSSCHPQPGKNDTYQLVDGTTRCSTCHKKQFDISKLNHEVCDNSCEYKK